MNNPLRNQIPAEDQLIADQLTSTAQAMHISPTFQSKLETQLMNAYPLKNQPNIRWFTKIFVATSWAVAGLAGILFLSWALRALIPGPTPAQEILPIPELSFDDKVRNGIICTSPLALAHGFKVYLSNTNKTDFLRLDSQKTIGELRSLAWSPDGQHLAIVGNTTGNGNVYITDSEGTSLQPVLSNSDMGYLTDAVWSHDGKQLLIWGIPNNSMVYIVNSDGTGLEEIKLDGQIFAVPQFTPDNSHIIFYGADSSSGLFEADLSDKQLRPISTLVEDASGFAWSPDGSYLAYMEMDREIGEARLISEEFSTGNKKTLTTFPISKGSGASIPNSANLNWSPDSAYVLFEFGRGQTDRAIYLAYADGTGMVKLADGAHAPAISADGCLAYIRNDQVFLMDMTGITLMSIPPAFGLSDLPKSISDFRLDKLQWGSISNP